jgi:hypothetical protein
MTDLAYPLLSRRPSRAGFALAIIVCLLVPPAAFTAIALGFGLLALPYQLSLVLDRLPVAFPMHMIASGLALILIPIAAVLRQRRVLHRAAGRTAAVCVAVGGTTALMVAVASQATLAARAGLFAQGLVWLCASPCRRRGDPARCGRASRPPHDRDGGGCLRAIWLRFVLYAAVAAGLPLDPVYAAACWACWIVPLALAGVVSAVISRRNAERESPESMTAISSLTC